MTQKTILNASHRALGARMVDFGGWDMPVAYGSQIEEHHRVRRDVGMFDVSHMTVVDLRGTDTRAFLRKLVANSVDKLKVPGKALYTCMLTLEGGIIDDLIVYFMADDWFRLVVNAGTREKDLAWIRAQVEGFDVAVDERPELAMIAVQGPQARETVAALLGDTGSIDLRTLGRFAAATLDTTAYGSLFVARTGYTGEDGFEIVVESSHAVALWDALREAGVAPAGLGARDTLRLEAGLALYGQDMDETVSPYEAALGWTVALDDDRAFNGRALLEAHSVSSPRQMIGLVMDDKGVLRHGQTVTTAQGVGEILSGTFSPTISKAIAFARVPAGEPGEVTVDIRGRQVPVRVVKVPFVRGGRPAEGV